MRDRWSFSRNTRKHDIFCVHVQVLQTWRHAPLPKKIRLSYPAKIYLKVIDFLDWHSRKSSSNSLYFHGYFTGVFIYCSPAKKNRKLNIWDWSLTSSWIYLLGDILQWIIFNTFHHSALRSCIWRCAWAPTKEIICPLGDGL